MKATKERAVLIFNESCPFCNGTAHWLQRVVGHEKLAIIGNKNKDALGVHPDFTPENIDLDVHLVTVETKVKKTALATIITWDEHFRYSRGEAVVNVLALKRGLGWLKKFHDKFPPMRWAAELFYKLLKKIKGWL